MLMERHFASSVVLEDRDQAAIRIKKEKDDYEKAKLVQKETGSKTRIEPPILSRKISFELQADHIKEMVESAMNPQIDMNPTHNFLTLAIHRRTLNIMKAAGFQSTFTEETISSIAKRMASQAQEAEASAAAEDVGDFITDPMSEVVHRWDDDQNLVMNPTGNPMPDFGGDDDDDHYEESTTTSTKVSTGAAVDSAGTKSSDSSVVPFGVTQVRPNPQAASLIPRDRRISLFGKKQTRYSTPTRTKPASTGTGTSTSSNSDGFGPPAHLKRPVIDDWSALDAQLAAEDMGMGPPEVQRHPHRPNSGPSDHPEFNPQAILGAAGIGPTSASRPNPAGSNVSIRPEDSASNVGGRSTGDTQQGSKPSVLRNWRKLF